MYDRLELGCAQYFVVEDALGKQWAIAWCRQCDGRHCGRFDQRARMFGGMLEFETLAAPRHIDGGLVVRRGDGIMDAIVEGGDFETRQRPRRTGKRFGRSRSESTKERAWFCCPRTYRRFGVRSEEHTSELQSLMRISYAVFCLKKKNVTHGT